MNTPGAAPRPNQPSRRDRTSRIVFFVILGAVTVPMIWLVISSALRGPDAVNFDQQRPSNDGPVATFGPP